MHNAMPFIALLACPIGMALMGGAGWLWAKTLGLSPRDAEPEKRTTVAGIE
jgi:hypothetical protein